MKLRFILVLTLCMPLILSCCAPGDTDYLSFIEYPMTVKGTAEISDFSTEIVLELQEGYARLDILSPERLKGYSYVLDPESKKIFYDDTSISFSENEADHGVLLLLEAFSVDAATLNDIGTRDIEGKQYLTLCYPIEEGEVTFFKEKNEKLPKYMTCERKGKSIRFKFESIEY